MENERKEKLAEDCRILLNGILGCAEIGYLGESLRFSDAAIDTLVKAIFPAEYKETFARLKAEKDKLLEEAKARTEE
jgi:hypothetical protein